MSTPLDPTGRPGEPTTPYDGVSAGNAAHDTTPDGAAYGAAPYNAWQDAYPGEPDAVASPAPRRPSTAAMRMAALVAAAAVAGGGVTYVLSHGSSSDGTTPVASTGTAGQLPGGTAPQGGIGTQPGAGQGGPGGGFGGVDGEQRIFGTISAVGSSSITLATSSGTQTYPVTSSTEIAQDGAQASLSDLTKGEVVLVHLIPSSSGSSDFVVERIIAGTGGFGRRPDDGSDRQGSDDANSTGLST
jgi:hypothetical protein